MASKLGPFEVGQVAVATERETCIVVVGWHVLDVGKGRGQGDSLGETPRGSRDALAGI